MLEHIEQFLIEPELRLLQDYPQALYQQLPALMTMVPPLGSLRSTSKQAMDRNFMMGAYS